jgi:hypothetical protein
VSTPARVGWGSGRYGHAVACARTLYETLNDAPRRIPELCHPDVRIALSLDLPFGGGWAGRAGAATCLELLAAAVPDLCAVPKTYLPERQRVIVLGFVHLGDADNSFGFSHVCEFTPEGLLLRFRDRTNPYRILAGMSRQVPSRDRLPDAPSGHRHERGGEHR